MTTKLLLPWTMRHDDASYSVYSRCIYGHGGEAELFVTIEHYKSAGEFYVNARISYITLDEAKEAADKQFVDNGYILLSEERLKKLEILL